MVRTLKTAIRYICEGGAVTMVRGRNESRRQFVRTEYHPSYGYNFLWASGDSGWGKWDLVDGRLSHPGEHGVWGYELRRPR